jgi:hypothetical protein
VVFFAWLLLQRRIPQEWMDFVADNVLSAFPDLFGADTEEQRAKWTNEMFWSLTIIDTRVYGARFEGDVLTLIPVLDLLNHKQEGSLSFHHTPESDPSNIQWYGKRTTLAYNKVRKRG